MTIVKAALKAKIIAILKSAGYRVIPCGTNSRAVELVQIFKDEFDTYYNFARIVDGNIAYINKNDFPEAYEKILEIVDNSIYELLLSEFQKNLNFKDKYCPKSGVRHTHEGASLYYNKRTATLYAVPKIVVVTPSSYSSITFTAKMLSKPSEAVDQLNKEFYSFCFQNVLEKPLNEYTEDELTVFKMKSI